jgi:nucleotide-binding universal stress UspA family protein
MKTLEYTTRIELENILLTTDFSPASSAPLACAEALARYYGSKIFVVHVIASESDQAGSLGTGPSSLKHTGCVVEEQRPELLGLDRLQGVRHEFLMEEGNVCDVITDLVRRLGIDLLVLGTHGRRGFQKFMLGSVAEAVFRRAVCPVLTVGPRAYAHDWCTMKLRRILFSTDLTPPSLAALPLAVSLAQEHQAQLTLLHLVHPDIHSPSERDRIRASYETQLHHLIPEESKQGCETVAVVEFSTAAEGILTFAERQHSDLIVLGVRRMSGLDWAASHIPSPTAYIVAAQSYCPVMTVRRPQNPMDLYPRTD